MSDDEVIALNELYEFELEKNNILVKCKHYNRIRPHPINKSFFVNSKVRKFTFTPEAMNIYKELFTKIDTDLVTIQNSVNKLYILYQQVNVENVKLLLKKGF